MAFKEPFRNHNAKLRSKVLTVKDINNDTLDEFIKNPTVHNILKSSKSRMEAARKFGHLEMAYKKKLIDNLKRKNLLASTGSLIFGVVAGAAIVKWMFKTTDSETKIIDDVDKQLVEEINGGSNIEEWNKRNSKSSKELKNNAFPWER